MSGTRYAQFCALARAAEILGERWTLLIIRDLLVGPKRFTDLRRGLPHIPTNLLSARLKELEQGGIVQRRLLPRPTASIVYELTEYGKALDDIVLQLGRWGAQSLGEAGPAEIVTVDSLIMALRSTFRPEAARGHHVGYELHVGSIVIHARIDDGLLEAREGPLTGADLVIEAGPAIRALMAGEISPAEAVENGSVHLIGDPSLLARFVGLFHIPPRPSALPT